MIGRGDIWVEPPPKRIQVITALLCNLKNFHDREFASSQILRTVPNNNNRSFITENSASNEKKKTDKILAPFICFSA